MSWCRIIGPALAVLALALLQACSAVKLAYNNTPELAYWWIDSYADLDEAQPGTVREELARLHQWHRGTELPKVAELLQKARRIAIADTTPEQACELFANIRVRIDAVILQAEPASVALAMDLSAAQLANIKSKFKKNNAGWRDDWVKSSPAERLDKRMKSARERSEDFYGALDERQATLLREALARSSFDPALNFGERVRRQQDLLQTLRLTSGLAGDAKPNAAQATSALRAYLERSISSPNPAYRAWTDNAILEGCRTVALLHNSTTPAQRERAQRRLAAYERDARELAAQR